MSRCVVKKRVRRWVAKLNALRGYLLELIRPTQTRKAKVPTKWADACAHACAAATPQLGGRA